MATQCLTLWHCVACAGGAEATGDADDDVGDEWVFTLQDPNKVLSAVQVSVQKARLVHGAEPHCSACST